MSYSQYINDLLKNSTKEELIKMYEMFEQSKSEAWQKYIELKLEMNKKQILFEETTSKLIKALDMACKLLEISMSKLPIKYIPDDIDVFGNRYEKLEGTNIVHNCIKNKQEWKAYLLKESEKQ